MLSARPRQTAQALVELALVMPVLVGMIAVLFQFGILFVAYQSMVHETRDVARWLAVHADTIDTNVVAHVNTYMPGTIYPDSLTGVCPSLGGHARPNGPVCQSPVDPSSTLPADQTAWQNQIAAAPNRLWVYMDLQCNALDATGHCASRPMGTPQRVTLAYDARNSYMVPTNLRFGPFFTFKVPTMLPAYDYSVMVEAHL